MRRVVFLPDRPVDREGDLFYALVAQLGLTDWVIDADPGHGDLVAYVGKGEERRRIDEHPSSGQTRRGRGHSSSSSCSLPGRAWFRHFTTRPSAR